MQSTSKYSVIAPSTVALAVTAALLNGYAAPAYAQEDEITVTGSRIRRQDYVANSPIVTVDTATFEQTSTIGLETILYQLPQFVPGVTGAALNGALEFNTGSSQFSSGGIEANAFQTPGASVVNLRGLGAGRNLVLIDGRRGMPLNATMTVDINSIPSAALERIEIISGGASAVYGADAVAGALNFILRDDFEGFQLDTSYGVPEIGDGEEYRLSGLFGATTEDGRGNVMLGLEHARRRAGDLNERDWFIADRANPATPGTDFFWSDTYLAADFTTFNFPSQAAINGVFAAAPAGSIGVTNDFYVNRTPTGTGSVYTGIVGFFGAARPGAYKYTGPLTIDGFPFRKVDPAGGLTQNQLDNPIAVPLERYSLFTKGRYDFNESISAFGHATFARTFTETASQFSPAVPGWAVAIPHGTAPYASSFANPTLRTLFNPTGAITGFDPVTGAPIFDPGAPTAAAYTTGGAFGLDCPATGGCTSSQAFPKPAEIDTLLNSRFNANADATFGRVLDFLGERRTENTTTNYQVIGGIEGELDNGFNWDFSLSHGESEAQSRLINFGSVERYRAIARSPNYGRAFLQTGNAAGAGFGGGTATCTSGLPLFEDFPVTEDCINAIRTTLSQNGRMTQETAEINLAGDVLDLPAGSLSFAVGAGYRKNEYDFRTTDNNRDINFVDLVMGLFPSGDTVGRIDVRELYGEVLVPLVDDGPVGARALSLEIGGRTSDYNTSGSVETEKILVDWTVVDWARVRGGYQKATRAPNIYELFTGRSLSVFSAGSSHGDVCSLNNFDSALSAATGIEPGGVRPAPATPAQAAQTRQLCEALMGPGGALAYYSQPITSQPELGTAGSTWITGNRAVQPETARTHTLGIVMSSRFDRPWLEGLTGSIDFFEIEMNDVISQTSTTLVNERCFSVDLNPTGDVNNQWCQNIARHPQTGAALATDVTFTNETAIDLSGIDFQVNWTAQFNDLGFDRLPGGVSVNLLATRPIAIETRATRVSPWIDWVGYQSGGECPSGISCTGYEYELFGTFNYFVNRLGFTLRWQRYPKLDAGARATNPNSTAIGILDDYDLFSLSTTFAINERLSFRGGIENLFDEDPPLAGGDPTSALFPVPPTHTTGGIYDPYGRRYFIGLSMDF